MMLHMMAMALGAGLVVAILTATPDLVRAVCPAHGAQPAKTDAAPATTAPTTAPKTTAPAAPAPKVAVAPAKPAPPPLDLVGLEKRLRDTKAIGVFTKLTLKNQVDDLLGQFKAFHERRSDASLEELRQDYNLLMLKVLSLLQSKDPPLARDLTASREAIWSVLTNPVTFSDVTRGG
jgi:hypothetical protein